MAALRPGAALLAAPLFGATAMPVQVRILLAVAVGLPAFVGAPVAVPPAGMVSVSGLLLVVGEVTLGLALGFAIQIGFAAALLAGEVIAAAMGLGFAALADPSTGQSSTAVGQFLNMLGAALFLAANGHLALIDIVLTSFRSIPPGTDWVSAEGLRGLVAFGGLMFAAGVTIALPVAAALLLVQLVMATVTRTAPALNLFAVGIPATILAGLALLAVATPVLADALDHAFGQGLDQARTLARL